MDIHEFKCSYEDCDETADFKCNCQKINMHCSIHFIPHIKVASCKFEDLYEIVLLKKNLLVKNAYNSLKNKLIALSSAEVGKANAFLRRNYNLIEAEQFQIIISIDNAESLDYIPTLASKHSIKNGDKRYFTLNTQYLLSINGKSEEYKNELHKCNNDEASRLIEEIKESEKKQEFLQSKYPKILAEIKKKEKMAYNKKYMEQNFLYAEKICNLESAKFGENDISQKIEFLIQQEYEGVKNLFVDKKREFEAIKISMTNRIEFIFICKF